MRPGWEIKTIGEVCEIYNGGTPSTSIPEYWDGGIQWITPKDMGKSKEMYVSCCERTISQEGVEHSSTKVLPERSVIVSSRAPIGYVAINDVPMATNQGCKGFVLGKELYPEFLYYFLLASTELLNKLGTGATFKEVSGKKLAGIEIPVPSIPEQKRIVDILDQEFAKIDALKANAEKSLQAAKDLFQATLKKELEPKEGWLYTTIGALCESVKYGTSKPSSSTGQYTYLRMNNITNDGFLTLADTKRIDITAEEEEKYLVRKGDILFNRTNSRELVGKTCVFQEEQPMVIAGYIIRLRVKNWVNPCLVSYYINHEPVRAELQKQSVGAVHQSNINAKTIQSFSIALPKNINEQNHIVRVLSNVYGKVQLFQENCQKTLSLCDDLKQSLLRKAFNGEL